MIGPCPKVESFSSIEQYVKSLGGDHPIKHILLATNGLSALKAILSIRHWQSTTFSNQASQRLSLLLSDDDMSSNLEAVRLVDSVIPVPGGGSSQNYGNLELIGSIVVADPSIDAVYVGWGHAAENPALVKLLRDLEVNHNRVVRFIGPSESAMNLLGDKIGSTIVAQSLGVPTVPWSGSNVVLSALSKSAEAKRGQISISPELYSQCHVHNVQEGLERAKIIGFPLMVKASNGGGGKGIRITNGPEDFVTAFHQVQVEVPNSPIFLMRVVNAARHIEVQILGDRHGLVTSLYGRDCSIQRRHQKIIEEAPATCTVPDAIFRRMEVDAIALAQCVRYYGAGTIEFLYDPATESYYFLEMNPRLQVEHPCTELITGVNIVASNLQIAMGIPLLNIPDISNFFPGLMSGTECKLDLDARRPPLGHAIAARITSENANKGFQPSQGRLHDIFIPSMVPAGPSNAQHQIFSYVSLFPRDSKLHHFSDSQFGHVFSFSSAGRDTARLNLLHTLFNSRINAEFSHNLNCLISILQLPEYASNDVTQIDTRWLDRLISNSSVVWSCLPRHQRQEPAHFFKRVLLCSLYLAHFKEFKPALDNFLSKSSSGVVPSVAETTNTIVNFLGFLVQPDNVPVHARISLFSPDVYRVCFLPEKPASNQNINFAGYDEEKFTFLARFKDLGYNNTLLISLGNGESHLISSQPSPEDEARITIGNNCEMEVKLRSEDPRHVISPSSGRIVRFLYESGQKINADSPIVEIEVMKMVMTLKAKKPGILHVKRQPDSSIQPGDLLAIIEPDASDDCGAVDSNAIPADFILKHEGLVLFRSSYSNAFVTRSENFWFNVTLNTMLGYDCDQKWINEALEEHLFQPDRSSFPRELLALLQAFSEPECLHQELVSNGPDSMLFQLCEKLANNPELILNFCRSVLVPSNRKNRTSLLERLIEHQTAAVRSAREEDESVAEAIKNEMIKLIERLEPRAHASLIEGMESLIFLKRRKVDSSPNASSSSINAMNNSLGSASIFSPAFEDDTFKPHDQLFLEMLSECADSESSLISCDQFFSDHLEKLPWNELVNYPLLCVVKYSPSDRVLLLKAFKLYFLRIFQGRSPESYPSFLAVGSIGFRWIDTLTKQQYQLLIIEEDGQYEQLDDTNIITFVYCSQNVQIPFEHYLIEIKPSLGKVKFHPVVNSQSNNPLLMNPIISELIEIERWSEHYDVVSQGQGIYLSTCKATGEKRFFLPVLIFSFDNNNNNSQLGTQSLLDKESGRILAPILHFLQQRRQDSKCKDDIHGHFLFIHCLAQFTGSLEDLLGYLQSFVKSYSARLWKAGISFAEIVFPLACAGGSRYRVRLCPGKGQTFDLFCYREVVTGPSVLKDKKLTLIFTNDPRAMNKAQEEATCLHSIEPTDGLTQRRMKALSFDTCFVYDIPDLISLCASERLASFGLHVNNSSVLQAREIILRRPKDDTSVTETSLLNDQLIFTDRAKGLNTIGVVCHLLQVVTPESYPQSRPIILISNDITFKHGSFGTDECELIYQVTRYARINGIPRFFISSNSGARIGLDEVIKSKFQIKWQKSGESSCSKNTRVVDYLYLSVEDYERYKECVVASFVPSENHYRIESVLGGFGVEQLKGSSKMAGETSLAYQSGTCFTLSLALGRSVGIGAYLLRLGHRVIQRVSQPILLTGYQALNRVLGNVHVYSSNLQMGGTHVLAKNGVTHLTVDKEWEAIMKSLTWLSYVPCTLSHPSTTMNSTRRLVNFPDCDWNRPVETEFPSNWTNSSLDIVNLLAGYYDGGGKFVAGLFDRDSWFEVLDSWAANIICGRARIGGLPLAVISSTMTPFILHEPNDPARSQNSNPPPAPCTRPGGVWFTDSSEKTHTALRDSLLEGLDIVILAHFRGFSGGVTDMYQGILKQGSGIVEALVDLNQTLPQMQNEERRPQQKVIVYILPFAELRGGAFVVIDNNILYEKSDRLKMELWVDESASAGVLESVATMGLKYRTKDIEATINRLEPLETPIDDELFGSYSRAAEHFVKLHDNPKRMVAKSIVDGVTDWKSFRRLLYQRLASE